MSKKPPVKQAPKKASGNPPKANNPAKRDYHVYFLWAIIIFISIIRFRLVAVPFERDEGEYGYIGNLFLHGVAPYKDAFSMKLPGTSFMYSIFMLIFGHTNTGVHTGLLFMNAATMFLLFTSLKKIINPFVGLATATVYGLMAIGLPFDAFAAHATHFICFYSSLALLFLSQYMNSGKVLKVFLVGLMFGMAFLMKQQAVFLILFGGIFLIVYFITEKKLGIKEMIKPLVIYGAGVFIPYIIVVLITLVTGQFHVFWLWTVQYASTYEAVKKLHDIMLMFNVSFNPAWDAFYPLWMLALGGACLLYFSNYTRIQKIFLVLYILASAGVVSSGFYFRQHYFIAFLPSLGLLTGVFIEFVLSKLQAFKFNSITFGTLAAVVIIVTYVNREYYFKLSPETVCKMAYWGNPFIEAQEISKYIKSNTSDTDKVAVLGSEPEIYFYTNRISATGYLYTYPLVEKQPYNTEMQKQMIDEIGKSKPAFIVFCNISYSWLVQADSPKDIFLWSNDYTHNNYTPVGFADFYTNQGWRFYWGNDIANRTGTPDSFIIIFKRNPEKKA